MKILVTGGLGFIGSHTVVSLIENGFEPIIIDNCSNASIDVLHHLKKITNKEIPFYNIDVTNLSELNDVILSEQDIKGVIHFAAVKAVGESVSNPLKYYHNNITGLVNLLMSMNQYKIHHLIFSSSCTVYGQAEKMPITEDAPIQNPTSPYGNTKKIGEEIIKDTVNSSDLKAILLRYFNPVGAHDSTLIGELPIGVPQNLIPFVTQTAVGEREVLSVFGNDYDTPDGTCVRDYIHVMDLADAHVISMKRLVDNKQLDNLETFNIGTGKGSSVLEVIESFKKTTNIDLNYKFAPRRAGDTTIAYADTVKANTVLGWNATRSLDVALESAWKWQQKISKA